jgi:hypothetical protein
MEDSLQSRTVDELKKLANLLSEEKNKPTRKAELIAFIQRQLQGSNLRATWEKLDELRRMDEFKRQTGKGKRGLTAVAGRRAAVNAMLSQCPPSRWIEVDEFFRYMRSSVEDFEVTRKL